MEICSTSHITQTNDDLCIDLARQFIEKLKKRNKARVDLANENNWLEGAFTASAGAGNPKGSVLGINPQTKLKIEIIITNFLAMLANETLCGQSRFEWLFANAVHQIEETVSIHSQETCFSFGRAQKITAIVIKYCYVWWLREQKKSPKFGDISWIDKWRPYLYVPVDRKTMEHLSRNRNYRNLAYEAGNSALVSWKWRMDEYRYLGIQDAIRKLAYSKNLDPICFDMACIWISAKDCQCNLKNN